MRHVGLAAVALAPLISLLPAPARAGEAAVEFTPARGGAGLWFQERYATGDWGGLRTDLEDRGIVFYPWYTGEALANLAGGIRRGARSKGLLEMNLDLDLEALAGAPGLRVHALGDWIHGEGLTEGVTGDLMTLSNIDARNGLRLFEAWAQQTLLDGRLTLRGGIVSADQEFLTSDHLYLLVDSAFGMPPGIGANLPVTAYPVGALGATACVEPVPGVFFRAGVFDGDPCDEETNPAGVHLDLRAEQGLTLAAEAGVRFDGGGEHPGTYEAGAFWHTGRFERWRDGEAVRGNFVPYVTIDQMLFCERAREDRPSEGLSLTARAMFAPYPDRSVVAWYADGCLRYTGLLPGRDDDIAAVGVAATWISAEYARAQAVDDAPRLGHETALEATYQVFIAPWLVVQPDLQYIVHPGGSAALDDAVVAGVRVTIDF